MVQPQIQPNDNQPERKIIVPAVLHQFKPDGGSVKNVLTASSAIHGYD